MMRPAFSRPAKRGSRGRRMVGRPTGGLLRSQPTSCLLCRIVAVWQSSRFQDQHEWQDIE
jgi:hypothetical protein